MKFIAKQTKYKTNQTKIEMDFFSQFFEKNEKNCLTLRRFPASTKHRFRLQGSWPGYRVQGKGSGFRARVQISRFSGNYKKLGAEILRVLSFHKDLSVFQT